jgi:hypothetical protein
MGSVGVAGDQSDGAVARQVAGSEEEYYHYQ